MLENWIYDPTILKRLGSHYATGDPLPKYMIEKKLQSEKVCKSFKLMY